MTLTLVIAGCAGFAVASDPGEPCTLLTDFGPGEGGHWRTVNDDVMGGRSSGGPAFEPRRMVFAGSTNTRGGGFSSVRRTLAPGALEGAQSLALTVTGDGRGYMVILQTGERHGGARLSYRAPLTAEAHAGPTRIEVPLSAFEASVRGRSVGGYTLDATAAEDLGIIVNDRQDGPFRLIIHEIRICRSEQAGESPKP